MDSSSFDRLTRLFVSSGSRRALGGALLGSLAGLLGLEDAVAAPCPKGKKRCKKRCIPRRNCCTNGNCRPGATGKVCRGGRCQCPPARPKICNGRCIPRAQCCGAECRPPDPCGNVTCGAVPNGNSSCQNGSCVVTSCDAGFNDCNDQVADGCETNLLTSEAHCGACDDPCLGNQLCCGGDCKDILTDASNCGDCGTVCTPEAQETCGRNGTCAGGICQFYGPGTRCRAATCPTSTTSQPQANCPGGGASCPAPQTVPCAPFACDSGSGNCFTNCAGNDTRCAPTAFCNGTVCEPKRPLGAPCGTPSFCQSGFCVNGFCCASACPPAANATNSCTTGTCTLVCNPGFQNCNGNPADGCECAVGSTCTPTGGEPNSGTRQCSGGNCVCIG